ncbi:MAG: hypothetical protein DI601_00220 [Azospirillum brasilense]|nr:MAG: hypothetical protein DI601_00220 [Azospirillum brasilense]
MSNDDDDIPLTPEVEIAPLAMWRRYTPRGVGPETLDVVRRVAFQALHRLVSLAEEPGTRIHRIGRDLPSWASLLGRAHAGDSQALLELAELVSQTARRERDLDHPFADELEWGPSHDLERTVIWLAGVPAVATRAPMADLLLLRALMQVPRALQDDRWAELLDQLAWMIPATADPVSAAQQLSLYASVRLAVQAEEGQSAAARQAESKAAKTEEAFDMLKALAKANGERAAAQDAAESEMASMGRWALGPASGLEKDTRKSWGTLCDPMPVISWPEPDVLRAQLVDEFPWLAEVVDGLLADLELQQSVSGKGIRLLPTVLVGPAGCGKSRILHRLRTLHRGTVINCSGMSDNRTFAGTSRGWSTANPSAASIAAAQAGCLNPLVGLDELDKIGELDGRNGDPRQTLLTQLERTTSVAWMDEGLGMLVDCSRVSWVATANARDKIPPLLRTRFRFLQCGLPRADDFPALWQGCLADLAGELGTEVWALPAVDPAARMQAEEGYRRGSLSARSLARVVRAAVVAAGQGERAAPRH